MGRKLESYRVLIPYSEPGIRAWLDKQRRPNMSVYMLIRQHLADTEEPMDVLETITVSRARHKKTVEDVAKDAGFKVKKAVRKAVQSEPTVEKEPEHTASVESPEVTGDGADVMRSVFGH